MIIIRDKATGETVKYYGACKECATKDSFCTNRPTSVQFRRNWHAIVDYFMENPHFTQCLLKDRFEVVL